MLSDTLASPNSFVVQSVANLDLMVKALSSEDRTLDKDSSFILEKVKDGATALGLMFVTELATDLERVLLDIQLHQRPLTPAVRAALLSVITVLKDSLLDNDQADKSNAKSTNDVNPIKQHISAQHNDNDKAMPVGLRTWDIDFKPLSTYLHSGGEPLAIFQALAILGDLNVEVDQSDLPLFSELDPEQCYLSWHLNLTSYATQQDIEDIFKRYQAEEQMVITRPENTVLPLSMLAHAPAQTDKLDMLQSLLLELTQTQQTLLQIGEHFNPALWPKFDANLTQLVAHTHAIEDVVGQMRMWPIHHLYQHVKLVIDALAETLGKKVELMLSGGELEVDKAILEKVIDPVVQLVTIALEHDNVDDVTVQLTCTLQDGYIVIVILCSGTSAGIAGPLPENGASTFTIETVKKAIGSLNGNIKMDSIPEQGVMFTVSVPQQHWIMQGQGIMVGDEQYILPLSLIIESLEIAPDQLKNIAGKGDLYLFDDAYIPVFSLTQLLDLATWKRPAQQLLIIMDIAGQKIGIVVDELLSQQRVVVTHLERHYCQVKGFYGASIMGDDSAALVLNIAALIEHHTRPFDDKATLNDVEVRS